MHVITGVRDPAASFPLASVVDEHDERRRANRAILVSAIGLAVTGLIELVIAMVSGSVALLGDALHNLSDVSTSVLVFVGFRASRKLASDRFPYGYERAEDLAGIGVAVVIWASAIVAGAESVAKLLRHGATHHVSWGIAACVCPSTFCAWNTSRWSGHITPIPLRTPCPGLVKADIRSRHSAAVSNSLTSLTSLIHEGLAMIAGDALYAHDR